MLSLSACDGWDCGYGGAGCGEPRLVRCEGAVIWGDSLEAVATFADDTGAHAATLNAALQGAHVPAPLQRREPPPDPRLTFGRPFVSYRFMVPRPFWRARIERAWRRAPIVWLSGVRRVGKTTLVQSVPGATYLNCDLPSVQERLRDPESFYAQLPAQTTLVLDEVHQLADPSQLLKIGADTRPKLRVVATGSSTLAATQKFKDSLTGRKRNVELMPVLWGELAAFGATAPDRLLRGGLPPALLAERPDHGFYAEWMDSYFARDVQELFRVEKRAGFLALLQTLLRQSAGLAEVTHLARSCQLSRPTIMNYLNVLETTHTIRVLRPHHGGSARELAHQPKIFGFDTGFVCYARGWESLRSEDFGGLWEHVVLETLAALPVRDIAYWRDKSQREVDFVLPRERGAVDAIECKWSPAGFSPKGLAAFRELHRRGKNYLVTPSTPEPYERDYGGVRVEVVSLEHLAAVLSKTEPDGQQ